MLIKCSPFIHRFTYFWHGSKALIFLLTLFAFIPGMANSIICVDALKEMHIPSEKIDLELNRTTEEIVRHYKANFEGRRWVPEVIDTLRFIAYRQFFLHQFATTVRADAKSSSEHFLSHLSFGDIELLSRYPELCRKIAVYPTDIQIEPIPLFREKALINPDTLYKSARLLILARKLLSISKNSNFMTEEMFREYTDLEGLKAQTYLESYRFDSRSPDDIRTNKGFYPNKRLGSVFEHSSRGSQGEGFISLSLTPGNEFNLLIAPVLMSGEKISVSNLPKDLAQKANAWRYSGRQEVLETYEYVVTNQLATKPHPDASIAQENEVVAPFVEMSRIVRYRKIIYVLDNKGPEDKPDLIGVSKGAWLDF